MLKIIVKFLIVIGLLILMLIILQYGINKKYTFPEPNSFKGAYIYNPYRTFDKTKWRMANFHAHTWKIFGGKKKAAESIHSLDSLYRFFGYDIINISDYQRINRYENNNEWFVPVYEHGYLYYKNHFLVLNAKKLNWLDFPFRQTLSNKQFIIDNLKKDRATLITIVHPMYRRAHTHKDLRYLSNYDCLEIANSKHLFISYYDTILSSGHPVFIMADDDSHLPKEIDDICSSFNLINTDLSRDSILNSLRTGRSIGVKFNIGSYNTSEEKRAGLMKLPEVNSITFLNDTLTVGLNQSVKAIKFIGQDGAELKVFTNCSTASCLFRSEDSYIRTEIECNDGTIYFLNPLFRFNGITLTDYTPVYNALKTWTWRSAFLLVIVFIFVIRKQKR